MTVDMRTRVKVCGITRVDDAIAAVDAGVDALGLVFYPPSSRFLEVARAAEIAAQVSAFVSVVGLFLDASRETVGSVLRDVPIDLLQFHGCETAAFCSSFERPYIKAIGMQSGTALNSCVQDYADAKGFLLDSHAAGEAGGTGKRFDWSTVPYDFPRPLILAGGLKPDNVGEAIRTTRPYAIDLSSGVESQPGIKDRNKITRLMNEVRKVDNER